MKSIVANRVEDTPQQVRYQWSMDGTGLWEIKIEMLPEGVAQALIQNPQGTLVRIYPFTPMSRTNLFGGSMPVGMGDNPTWIKFQVKTAAPFEILTTGWGGSDMIGDEIPGFGSQLLLAIEPVSGRFAARYGHGRGCVEVPQTSGKLVRLWWDTGNFDVFKRFRCFEEAPIDVIDQPESKWLSLGSSGGSPRYRHSLHWFMASADTASTPEQARHLDIQREAWHLQSASDEGGTAEAFSTLPPSQGDEHLLPHNGRISFEWASGLQAVIWVGDSEGHRLSKAECLRLLSSGGWDVLLRADNKRVVCDGIIQHLRDFPQNTPPTTDEKN